MHPIHDNGLRGVPIGKAQQLRPAYPIPTQSILTISRTLCVKPFVSVNLVGFEVARSVLPSFLVNFDVVSLALLHRTN